MAEDLGKNKSGDDTMASQTGSKAISDHQGGAAAPPQDSKLGTVDDNKPEKETSSESNSGLPKTTGLGDKKKDDGDDKKLEVDPAVEAPNESSIGTQSTAVDDKKAPNLSNSRSGDTPAAVPSSTDASISGDLEHDTQGPTSSQKESTATTSAATSTQPLEAANKKRKIAAVGGSGTPSSAATISTPSLSDSPVVTRMVQNIFTILMTCK